MTMITRRLHMYKRFRLGFMISLSIIFLYYGNALSVDKKQIETLKKAALQGDLIAQNELGLIYLNGDGIPLNYVEAMQWFKKAAEKHDAKAQNNLGVMYLNGDGVPQNYVEAIKWFTKAAGQGHDNAQYNLGIVHEQGKGVPENLMEAYVWYSLAAAQGHKDAKHNLIVIEPKLTSKQIAESQKKAAALWEKYTNY